jgi:hypothetical protein
VVGYGLDDNSLKRNYRNIYKINWKRLGYMKYIPYLYI